MNRVDAGPECRHLRPSICVDSGTIIQITQGELFVLVNHVDASLELSCGDFGGVRRNCYNDVYCEH